jgi:protocatechuate 3,4-dioxygenase beta subunit
MNRRLTSMLLLLGAILLAAAAVIWLVTPHASDRAPADRSTPPSPEPSARGLAGGPSAPTTAASRPARPPATAPIVTAPPSTLPGVFGAVVDAETRAPLPRARVAARPKGGGAVRGVETDAAGRFAVRGLPPGSYEVVAAAEGFLAGPPVLAESAPPTAAASIEIALERGLPVRGRVVDPSGAPVTGATVELHGAPSDRFAGPFRPVVSRADGGFEVPGVPPGEGFRVAARAPGLAAGEAAVPAVRAPDGVSGVVVVVRRYRIAGRAEPPPGEALPPPGVGVTVEVLGMAGGDAGALPAARTPLDGEGRFEAAVPSPGHYIVRAAPGGLEPTSGLGAQVGRRLASPAVPVEVAADGSAPEVVLRLERPVVLEGTVVDPEGRPLPSTSVRARGPRDATVADESCLTSEDGSFRLLLLPRDHSVAARRPGYVPERRERVRPGAGPLRIVLRPALNAVPASGRFRGADGKALAGLVVRFDAGDDAEDGIEARVDAEGRLEVSALAPGTYTQSFVEPGGDGRELRVRSRRIEVEPGRPADVGFEDDGARGRILGLVEGAPPGDAVTVNLQPAEEPRDRFGFLAASGASPSGEFAFGSVPPGRYALRAACDAGSGTAEVVVSAGAAARVRISIEAARGTGPPWPKGGHDH